jgi:hypothetical protein
VDVSQEERHYTLTFLELKYNKSKKARGVCLRGLLGGIIIVACVVGMNLRAKREIAVTAPLQEEVDI